MFYRIKKVLFHTDLTETEDGQIRPSGSIAQAQVWSHYTGFLRYVLPSKCLYQHAFNIQYFRVAADLR